MNYCSSKELLNQLNAPATQENSMIAETIIRMYCLSVNMTYSNVVELMNEYIVKGSISFSKYKLNF